MQRRELPDGWDAEIPSFDADEKGIATRKASNKVENAIAASVPWLLAGSADLTGSTSVGLDGAQPTSSPTTAAAASSTRDPRARVGGDLERPLALQAAARSGPPTSPSPTTPGRRSASRR